MRLFVCVLLRNKINAFCRKTNCRVMPIIAWMTSKINISFIRKLRVLGLFFRHVIHGYYFTIIHRLTSGRSLQDLNVCTVNPQLDFIIIDDILKYTYVPKLFLIHCVIIMTNKTSRFIETSILTHFKRPQPLRKPTEQHQPISGDKVWA